MSDSGRVVAAGTDYSQNTHMYNHGSYAPANFIFPLSPADDTLVTKNVTFTGPLMVMMQSIGNMICIMVNNNLPTVHAANLTDRNYKAVNLTPGATYYWKVVVKDGSDAVHFQYCKSIYSSVFSLNYSLETPFVNFTQYVTSADLLWKGSENLRYLSTWEHLQMILMLSQLTGKVQHFNCIWT